MRRLWRAFCYSLDGLAAAWKDEPAFRQEVVLAFLMIGAAFFLAPNKFSLLWMISSVLLVLALELVNTAVEAAIDRTSEEIHPLAKKAKDTASAAVLIALLHAGFVWGIILFGNDTT